jgi:HNH endonuclease
MRAQSRCEYCQFPDAAIELPFHVEHVIASIHRRVDEVTNLAWACPRCNLKKGPNLTTVDPETNAMVKVFNPRKLTWSTHFEIRAGIVIGRTPCGRGTVRLLGMNDEHRLAHRRALIAQGLFGDIG